MKPAELLNAGADKIENIGWVQDDYSWGAVNDNDEVVVFGYCALGSMRSVLGIDDCLREGEANKVHPVYAKAKTALKKVMIEQLDPQRNPHMPMVIPAINDTYGRTAEEIVACMRKAANNLEA